MALNKKDLLQKCAVLISELEAVQGARVKSRLQRFELEGLKSRLRESSTTQDELLGIESRLNAVSESLHPTIKPEIPSPLPPPPVIPVEEKRVEPEAVSLDVSPAEEKLPEPPALPEFFILDESEIVSSADEMIRLQMKFCNDMQEYFRAYEALSDPIKGSLPAHVKDHMETVRLVAATNRKWVHDYANIPPEERTLPVMTAMFNAPEFHEQMIQMKFHAAEFQAMNTYCHQRDSDGVHMAGVDFVKLIDRNLIAMFNHTRKKGESKPVLYSYEILPPQISGRFGLHMEEAIKRQSAGLSDEEKAESKATLEAVKAEATELDKELDLGAKGNPGFVGYAEEGRLKFIEKITESKCDAELKASAIGLINRLSDSDQHTEKQKYQMFEAISGVVETVPKVTDELAVFLHAMQEEKGEYPESRMKKQLENLEQIRYCRARIPDANFLKSLDGVISKARKPVELLRLENEIITGQKEYHQSLKKYYDAWVSLRDSGRGAAVLPALMVERMESIRALIETGESWLNTISRNPDSTVTDNILGIFDNDAFRNHLALYSEVGINFGEVQAFLETDRGRHFEAAMKESLPNDCNFFAIMPTQRLMRFPLLLKSCDDASKGIEEKLLGVPKEAPQLDTRLATLQADIAATSKEFNKNAFPGSEVLGRIYRKVCAEAERSHCLSDKTTEWIADLNNRYIETCRLLAEGNLEPAKSEKLQDAREKMEEKFSKVEKQLDRNLEKLLKKHCPVAERALSEMMSATIDLAFSRFKLRMDDDFKVGGLMTKIKTFLRPTLLPEPELFSGNSGILRKLNKFPNDPREMKMEPDQRGAARANLSRAATVGPKAPEDEKEFRVDPEKKPLTTGPVKK